MRLSPPEHEHSAAIGEAARYLALTPQEQIERPIVPHLQRTFGLSLSEACAACREAQNLRESKAG